MRGLLACALLELGCGASGPPAGQPHQPTNSPEAESACPEPWSAAKQARELMLGDDSLAAKKRTADAVLAQADCEVLALEGGAFAGGTHGELLAQVKRATAAHRDTLNLYGEVASYGVAALDVAAFLGRGRLHRVFAARLLASPMPGDITVAGEQSAYRAEVAALVSYFEREAERELREAISRGVSVVEAAAAVRRACAELTQMNRTGVDGC